MNILIIGNGFDLAHGLPTSYKNFLQFVETFKRYSIFNNFYKNTEPCLSEYIKKIKKFYSKDKTEGIYNELNMLITDNTWLKVFEKAQIKDGWIDFEKEISKIVQELEVTLKKENDISKQNKEKMTKESLTLEQKNKIIGYGTEVSIQKGITVREQKEIRLKDLNKLIRCLEIYLSDYIPTISVESVLPDIDQLSSIDKVLSFNYTNTFERLYGNHFQVEIDYIHGKADISKDIHTNNMVLGINEYLKGEEQNENIEFIAFKKFYQRIYKETGCEYKDWVAEIKADNDALNKENVKQHNLFIFGHSLDITDRDVLRDLILNDNVQTVIFYKDKEDLGRKIANLVRILGQDELIKRTGGTTKTITFKLIAKGK